ncbi:hypothetical protein [Legionella nagasakiensis]|uniref:hypothetical protein n=1 Tax=Legionella nagasakiensis TaxID=535290 RepID=UPI0010569BCD|nr:hypothetical protein [Legionella nagasakiensis]
MKKAMNYEDIFAMPQEELDVLVQRIYQKIQKDERFKQRLKEKPTEVLEKEGIKLQPGLCFQVVASKEEAMQLPVNVIPFPLITGKKGKVALTDLTEVAGGGYIPGSYFGNLDRWGE